jgi:predicted transcriptional regulator
MGMAKPPGNPPPEAPLNKPKDVLTVRVDQSIIARIDALAQATGETRSAIVERVLRQSLGEYESWVESFANPLVREVFAGIFENPTVLKILAPMVTGEKISPQHAKELARKVARLRQRARDQAQGDRNHPVGEVEPS